MTASVRPVSLAPPAAVTDLLASANPVVEGEIALTWTAPQGNVGGVPINNQTVASYTVGYATFSVTSIGGSTAAWWAHPSVTQVALSPPGYTPQSPGSFEGKTFTGLSPGTTFYFAVRSTSQGNVLSPIDIEAATPGLQAHALSTSLAAAPPATFDGTALSPTSIQWAWSPATGVSNYLIYSQPGNVLLQTLSPPATSWIETGLSTNTSVFRVIYSSNAHGLSSASTGASRSTLAAAPTGLSVTAITPSSADLSWNAGGNPAGTFYGLERSLDGVSFAAVTQSAFTTTTDSGLSGDTTYYYRVQGINGDGIGSAYSVALSTHTPPAFVVPAKPNGVLGARTATTYTLQWHAVTESVTGQPVSIAQYRIDRYTDIASSAPNRSVYVPSMVLSYSEAPGATTQYYRVVALAVGGGVSASSDFSDSSLAANRYAIADDDLSTRVVMPAAVAVELRAENNLYHEDLEVRLLRQAQDEGNTTLRSYHTAAYIARTGGEVFNFAFTKPAISVELGYAAALGGAPQPFGQTLSSNNISRANAGSIAQIIAVYWYNGSNFIRISDPILTSSNALAVTVRSLGTYQIRAARISNSFRLADGSPYPRIITPNGAENRKVFFFFDNPTDETVQGAIYDVHGAKVRDIAVDGQSPTSTALVWDGRDAGGAIVPSGVYLYKISAGSEKATGSVVVAR